MEENKKTKSITNSLKERRSSITVTDMDLSECGRYQELNGGWVIWMLVSGVILSFKNLYSGIALIIISVIIFLIYKKSPKNVSATYFNMALDFISNNEMEKAKDVLLKSTAINSENQLAHVLLSSIYYKEGNFRETIDNLFKSNVLKVQNSKYNYLVGACYFNIEDYENCIKYLNFVKFENNDPMKHIKDVLLAKAYCLNEENKKAIKVFNRILNIDDALKGNLIEFNYFLGLTYLKLGESEKALKELKMVFDENSEYRDVKELIEQMK